MCKMVPCELCVKCFPCAAEFTPSEQSLNIRRTRTLFNLQTDDRLDVSSLSLPVAHLQYIIRDGSTVTMARQQDKMVRQQITVVRQQVTLARQRATMARQQVILGTLTPAV